MSSVLSGETNRELKFIDRRGNVIIMAGTTCALTALTWGGIQFPWDSAHVLGPLIVGFIFIGLFFVYEFLVPKEPSLPLDILSNRTSLGG